MIKNLPGKAGVLARNPNSNTTGNITFILEKYHPVYLVENVKLSVEYFVRSTHLTASSILKLRVRFLLNIVFRTNPGLRMSFLQQNTGSISAPAGFLFFRVLFFGFYDNFESFIIRLYRFLKACCKICHNLTLKNWRNTTKKEFCFCSQNPIFG